MIVDSYRFKIILLVLLLVPYSVAFAADNRDQVSLEVAHLMTFIETSGCQFNRNGRWYDSVEAAKHIGKKYRYVKKRGLVKSSEDFIKYSATKSSMSGKVYTVQCPDRELLKSSEWLTDELTKYRVEENRDQ